MTFYVHMDGAGRLKVLKDLFMGLQDDYIPLSWTGNASYF